MKTLLVMLCLLVTNIALANTIDDVFEPGSKEFAFERYSDDKILLEIDKDAKIACLPNGQCVLSSGKSDSKGWEVAFNVGQGGVINSSGGTTIITGGYDSGSSNCPNCSQNHWGLTLSYKVGHCTQQVLVPRSLYYSMNRYLYGLMTEAGETRKGFTPADEAMIMLYSTIMKQASSSSCGGGR